MEEISFQTYLKLALTSQVARNLFYVLIGLPVISQRSLSCEIVANNSYKD